MNRLGARAVILLLIWALLFPGSPIVAHQTAPATHDVAMDRGNLGRTGVMPGPGPQGTPTLRWQFDTDQDPPIGQPVVVQGVLYFATQGGVFYALDAESGEEQWRRETGHPISWTPTIADGAAYFVSGDGHLYAIDLASHQERWKFLLDSSGQLDWGLSPLVVDGVAYIGSIGIFYAIQTSDGSSLWTASILDGGDINSPTFGDGFVYFTDAEGTIFAVNAKTGGEYWEQNTNQGGATIIFESGSIYLLEANEANATFDLVRRSAQDGDVLDQIALNTDRAYVPAVFTADQTLMYLSTGKSLIALDGMGGSQRWVVETAGDALIPAVSDGNVYFGDSEGTFYAYSDQGAELWRVSLGTSTSRLPVITNGFVYVAGTDGVYAIADASDGDDILIGTPASPVAEEEVGINGNTYVSPNYGYSLSWDETWMVQDESTAGSVDTLELTNGVSTVRLTGNATWHGDVNACLQGAVNALTTQSSSPPSLATASDGQALESVSDGRAYAVYLYTPNTGGEQQAVYLDCRLIDTKHATVLFRQETTVASFNDQNDARKALLAELILEHSAPPPTVPTASPPATNQPTSTPIEPTEAACTVDEATIQQLRQMADDARFRAQQLGFEAEQYESEADFARSTGNLSGATGYSGLAANARFEASNQRSLAQQYDQQADELERACD